MVRVVVSGDQTTSFGQRAVLPFFATPPFFCVPTLRTFSWGDARSSRHRTSHFAHLWRAEHRGTCLLSVFYLCCSPG